MRSDLTKPPEEYELEISLFGPGYGEAVAIHIGRGRWLLVDSCVLNSETKPASLKYLHDLNIDPASAVAGVVVSHWHDDHIRGIGEVVAGCESANVYISSALKNHEFLTVVSAHQDRSMMSSSGLYEFADVIWQCVRPFHKQKNNRGVRWVGQDRCLFQQRVWIQDSCVAFSVHSLSPSDDMITRAKLSLSALLPEDKQPKRRILAPKENYGAVALLVRAGPEEVLLGSDLQKGPKGWGAVIQGNTTVINTPGVFKIPHHGAESSHDCDIWALCSPDVFAITTPFSRGGIHLPNAEDVNRICGLTNQAYITGTPSRKKFKSPNSVIRRFVGERTKPLVHAVPRGGHIRLRKAINPCSYTSWRIELFGEARRLAQLVKDF